MRQRLQRRRPAVEGLQRGWGIGGGMPTLGAILARLTKRGTLEPTGRHRVNTPEQNKPPKTPVSQWAQVRACILGTCVFGLPGYMTASFIVPQLGESSYIARWIIPDQFFFFSRSSYFRRWLPSPPPRRRPAGVVVNRLFHRDLGDSLRIDRLQARAPRLRRAGNRNGLAFGKNGSASGLHRTPPGRFATQF